MTNENDSNSPPADSESQPPRQPPVIPPAPLQGALPDDGKGKADDTKNEADELAREFRAAEKWVIGTNITLAIIGLFALCIYNGQLKVMRGQLGEIIKQYPEIKKSADANVVASQAATESLNAIKTQFQIDERAWVGIVGCWVESNHPGFEAFTYSVRIKNVGKTPALGTHIKIGNEVYGKDFPNDPPYRNGQMIRSKGTLLPNQESEGSTAAGIRLQQQIDAVHAGTSWNYVYGTIVYGDVFGVQHWTHYCFRIQYGRAVVCDTYGGTDSDPKPK